MLDNIPRSLFNALGDTQTKAKLAVTITNVTPTITNQDIQSKVKTRYFAKYTSHRNGTIYEITQSTYSTISNNSLFRKTSINWILRGKLEDTVLTLPNGENILIKGVISQNKTLVALAEEELPGIINHLRNYAEFYSGE
jgi:hypothetical protein